MPRRLLNSFGAFINGGIRSILRKRKRGEEEKEQQQNGMETGSSCYLPEELMIESILTRLPARTLAVFSCVSKLWYNLIFNDSRFSIVHYHQNKKKLFLVFNLRNVSRSGIKRIYIYWMSLLGREKADVRFLSGHTIRGAGIYDPVGFCNGLACSKLADWPTYTKGSITVFNPIRGESLVLNYLRPTEGYIYLCHGFGFDSLSQVYKVVLVFASEADNEVLCMVVSLGTRSWRKIAFDMAPPPGSSSFPRPMVTRVPTLCKPATFCGGDLFWRTQNTFGDNNDKIEMLLSFDLHNEKIHFVRLPTECNPTTAGHEPQDLLEYKGYPCIARSERIIRFNNDHCGHGCTYQTGVCCCCSKVHMYILKDKQVWTREETFDVQIMDQEGLQPTHLCSYFDTSDAKPPPTRILTLSDQVLLYWFNGERLIFYNLQEKHLKVVECSRTYPRIFQTKMNENLERHVGDDDNIFCPSMDFQLHAQVENMVSLKTFIPKEANIIKSDCADEAMHIISNNNLAAGWLTTRTKKDTYSVFF